MMILRMMVQGARIPRRLMRRTSPVLGDGPGRARVGVRPHDEDGSSLPELLVAASLGVVALTVLATGLLGPVRSLELATRPDPRADQLELVRLELQRIVRAARPGLDEPAVLALDVDVLQFRIGDLTRADVVRLTLDHVGLIIEDGTGTRVVPVTGLDLSRSHLRPITSDGATVDPLHPSDAVAVHAVLYVRADEAVSAPEPSERHSVQRPRGELRAEHVVGLRVIDAIQEVAR